MGAKGEQLPHKLDQRLSLARGTLDERGVYLIRHLASDPDMMRVASAGQAFDFHVS